MVHRSEWILSGLTVLAVTVPVAGPAAQEHKLVPSDVAAYDEFGWDVACDGDWLAVGAHFADGGTINTGSVHLWRQQGERWIADATLTAADPGLNDQFGQSVALHGDLLAVGALTTNHGTAESVGTAYVFRDGVDGWTQEATLVPAESHALSGFGMCIVALDDRVIVGAPFADEPTYNIGTVHVFERQTAGWSQTQTLVAPDGHPEMWYGYSLAAHGDWLAVGSAAYGGEGFAYGAVYLYQRDAHGQYVHQQTVTAHDAATYDSFGHSVALQGRWLAVGSPFDDDHALSSGSVYVYERRPQGWALQSKLTSPLPAPSDQFGMELDLDGGLLAVASRDPLTWPAYSGSVHLFTQVAGAWLPRTRLKPGGATTDGEFGRTLAVDGGRVVVGDHLDSDHAEYGGAAYLFER